MKEVHFEIDLQISRIDKESVGHVRGELGRSERCCKKQPVHMRSNLSRQRSRAHFSRFGPHMSQEDAPWVSGRDSSTRSL